MTTTNNEQYPIPKTNRTPLINAEQYQVLYQYSIENPEAFWAEQAEKFIDWHQRWQTVSACDFNTGKIAWFLGAKLNVSYNCLDRHLGDKGDKIAFIWEGDNPQQSSCITYQELYEKVCQLTHGLKSLGVKEGDRVCLYMPMIIEAIVAMLACARLGAIHSVVFAGFSATALSDRIQDAKAKLVITADGAYRGGKTIALKDKVDKAVTLCDSVENVIVLKNTNQPITTQAKDIDYHHLVDGQPKTHTADFFDAEAALFILYTSGSTGKPKGVLHTSGGYLLYVSMTHRFVFDYQDGDIYWCSADIGWVTGHSYTVYGPLANGATSVIFEGVPTYPKASRFWEIIDKHRVNIFYTAPTAIRALMGAGDKFLHTSSRNSLKVLGTVGEPINPEAWRWYYAQVGQGRCPIVDTWWQTETGGHIIATLPYGAATKPGAAGLPLFGIKPEIVNTKGVPLSDGAQGILVFSQSWPGQMRTLYNDHQRFIDTYFSSYKGKYLAGDGARRDEDGYYWITGRIDDTLNVSGHRLGSAEIESALVLHLAVSEAAVVGMPHDIKGQGIYAFVSLMQGEIVSEELYLELIQLVRQEIGAIATIDVIQFSQHLPKTRSGKIMRRILRKIASGDTDNLGDVSTLAEPEVVQKLTEDYIAKNYYNHDPTVSHKSDDLKPD